MKEDQATLLADLAAAFVARRAPTSAEMQALVTRHHAGIERFYPCAPEMYRGLGRMYVDDARFTAYYDKAAPGLAAHLNAAIQIWCDKKETK
jgi:hypothetical protein